MYHRDQTIAVTYGSDAGIGSTGAVFLYQLGHAVYAMQNPVFAHWLWMRAARLGFGPAETDVGVNCDYGEGVAPDPKRAIYWYEKAAAKHNAYAIYDLANIYFYGRGVPIDYAKAFALYQWSAREGEVDAEEKTGLCFDRGDGVIRDDRQAAFWYQKAAAQGDSDANYNLALLNQNHRSAPVSHPMDGSF